MMMSFARRALVLVALLTLAPRPLSITGAPAACLIVEGAGIAGVHVGMAASAALGLIGPPRDQQISNSRVVYTLRPPWGQMVADRGVVSRISVVSGECRTVRGIGPGATLAQVRSAYSGVEVITHSDLPSAEWLAFPFVGIAFFLRAGEVQAVEIFRAETLPPSGRAPATPPPAPGATPAPGAPTPVPTTAPGTWGVRSISTRVQNGAIVVSGTVENRDRPLAVYADVRVFGETGRQVGQSEGPVQPALVPSGGTASFTIRVSVDQVVRRYTVSIRPLNTPSVVLARASGEIKDPQQFAAMAARQVQVSVQTTNPTPSKDTFVAMVSNGSPLKIEEATVTVEMTVTCRLAFALPPATPGRIVQETWTGTMRVRQIGPNASSQSPLQLSGGVCPVFLTWSASVRVSDVKIAE